MKCGFSSTFQGREYSMWAKNCGKVLPSKSAFHLLFLLPKSSFGEHACGEHVIRGCEIAQFCSPYRVT